MKYLLDSNVLSEARKRTADPRVVRWLATQDPASLAISVITLIELEIGILAKARTDPAQGRALTRWFEAQVLAGFEGRILPLDVASARRVAALHVPDRAPHHDAQIAGIALANGLTVATRNVRDFERAGVALVNPWS